MNSTTKGSLAAVVAALLLTGGAGTLAYWNDTENVPGGPISSASWTSAHPPAAPAGCWTAGPPSPTS
jgi:alternate signal-mediated exported protein